MTRLVFDLDQLARAVDRMRLFQHHLVRTHDTVEQRVQALQLTWTGEAAVAHTAAQQEWARAAEQTYSALEALHSIASTAHANYAAATLANLRMWSA